MKSLGIFLSVDDLENVLLTSCTKRKEEDRITVSNILIEFV